MQSQSWLAGAFGWLTGTSPGSGMAVMFILTGLAYMIAVAVLFLFVPTVRNLEDNLPDHDQLERLSEKPAASDLA